MSDLEAGSPGARYFNSVQVVANGGTIVDSYDKIHLVPFGEYLPFRSFFESLGIRQQVTLGIVGIGHGAELE